MSFAAVVTGVLKIKTDQDNTDELSQDTFSWRNKKDTFHQIV